MPTQSALRPLLRETALLDFSHPRIERLFAEREWDRLDEDARIQQIYSFVRDEILFGYNRREKISASQVLREGIGQCNTKAILLMALLRRAGFPCRLHAFQIRKAVQAGLMPASLYLRLPREIQHSRVEVAYQGGWIALEGVIVDAPLLASVQAHECGRQGAFCGFGIATDDLQHPQNEWWGGDTAIQDRAITGDLGSYDDPEAYYRAHPGNLQGLRGLFWRLRYHGPTNRRVAEIRKGNVPTDQVPRGGLIETLS